MSNERRTIELAIQAQFKGKQTVDSVNKSLAQVTSTLDDQAAAAKRGEGSFDDLKATLAALQLVARDKKGLQTLVDAVESTATALTEQNAKLATAEAKLEAYRKKIGDVSKATDGQAAKFAAYERAVTGAQTKIAGLQKVEADLVEALKAGGIEMADLGNAQQRLADTTLAVARAIAQAEDQQRNFVATNKQARDQARALSKEQEQFARAEAMADALRASRAKDAADAVEQAARRIINAQERSKTGQGEFAALQRQNDETKEQIRLQEALKQKRQDVQAAFARADADTGLKAQAESAEQVAKQYSTLARAATDLTPKVRSLKDAIADIQNPAKRATESLDGVEAQVRKLRDSVNAIKGPVSDYREQFALLSAAQDSLGRQAGLIDNFNKQTTALRGARTEFVAARANLAGIVAAMKQGGESADSFAKGLAAAQDRARTSATALQSQVTATRAARNALNDAGIATQSLGAAQERLLNSSRQAQEATQQLTASVDKYGKATESASSAAKKGLFGDEGRTTLSYVQRLRGEVLALATAYVGLQGAQNLASGAIDSTISRENTKGVLSAAIGTLDKKEIDKVYDYVRGQSDRIGLVFQDTAKEFASFAVAGLKSGRSLQEVKYIFEGMSEAGRVFGLTTDQMNGTFLALRQIFSSTKIQAEELNQLSERLPGLYAVAQTALKSQFPDLKKALADGKVGTENVVKIAEAYRKLVAEQLPGATSGIIAAQARLTNEINDFKLAIGDAGYANAYADALKRITEFLNSADGKKFANDASDAFSALARGIVFVLDNFKTLQIAGAAFVALFAGKVFANIAAGILATGTNALAASVDFKTAAGRMSAAYAAFQAVVVGFAIGTYFYDQFAIVKKAGLGFVVSMERIFAYVAYAYEGAFGDGPDVAKTSFESTLGHLKKFVAEFVKGFATIARLQGSVFAPVLDNIADRLDGGGAAAGKALDARKKRLDAKLADIDRQRKEGIAAIEAEGKDQAAAAKGPDGTPTPVPEPTKGKKPPPTDAEIKKRENAIESITKSLETLTAKIDRAQTDTLTSQLDAIDKEYAALQRKISALGGPEGAAFTKQLADLKAQYVKQVTQKFNDDLTKQQQAILSSLDQVDAAAGRKSKVNLQARLDAIDDQYREQFVKIAAYRDKLQKNGMDTAPADQNELRLRSAIEELKVLEAQKVKADQIAAGEKVINDVITERALRLKTNDDLVAGSIITEGEGRRRNLAIIDESQTKINEVVKAGLAFAETLGGAGSSPALDAYIAKLQLLQFSGEKLKGTFEITSKQLNDLFTSGATSAIDKTAEGFGKAITGAESLGDAIKGAGREFLNFAADFLKKIALMIIQQQILNAVQAAGGGGDGIGGFFSKLVNGTVKHDGGTIGPGPSNRSRNVAAELFNNAPRYHDGGVNGIKANEYTAILEDGEEVLKKTDARNVLNGGLKPVTAEAKGNRTVLVDDRSKIPEAMASPAGDNVQVEFLRRNKATVRSILGV